LTRLRETNCWNDDGRQTGQRCKANINREILRLQCRSIQLCTRGHCMYGDWLSSLWCWPHPAACADADAHVHCTSGY